MIPRGIVSEASPGVYSAFPKGGRGDAQPGVRGWRVILSEGEERGEMRFLGNREKKVWIIKENNRGKSNLLQVR